MIAALQAARAGHRRGLAALLRVARPADRGRPGARCSTTSRAARRDRAGARRLPRRSTRRDIHDGHGVPARPPAAAVHLVIASRADPPLPLARLRARGELVEIRAADLRFTPDEAAAYLNGVMGLGLSAGDVAALEGRTEGWIAALQLAGALDAGARRRRRRSSPASPATTATSSTTSSRRSCSASPSASGPSCCRPRSSAG